LNESEIFDAWFVKTKDNKQDSTPKPYKFIADESNNKKRKLEKIDNSFHYFLQASNRQEFKFGQYISITTLFETLCEGLDNIQIVYKVCINQHSFYMHNSSSVLLSTGTNSFNSINQWISRYSEPTRQTCNICNLPLNLKYTFENIPEFLVFDFGGLNNLK
jgi:hypothetical protein